MEKYLRRYTDVPALIYLLSERKITLLDPSSWDDKNDSHYLSVYKDSKNLKSLLALCFTQANETYHHWRIFAGHSSGVCIRFKQKEFIQKLKQQKEFKLKMGKVMYRTIPALKKKKPEIQKLPFIKRCAFKDEKEFRLLYESATATLPKLDVEIPLSCIERITLSPWLNQGLSDHLKKILKSIDGCGKLKFTRSTLVSNREWQTIGENVRSRRSIANCIRKNNCA